MRVTPEEFEQMLEMIYKHGGNPEWTMHVHPVTGERMEINWTALDEVGRAEAIKALRDGGYIK